VRYVGILSGIWSLGLEVSVSRPFRDVLTSRLGQNAQCLVSLNIVYILLSVVAISFDYDINILSPV